MKNTQKIFMALAVLVIAAVFCIAASKPRNQKNGEDTSITTTTTATAEVNSPDKAINTIKQYLKAEQLTVAEDNYYIPRDIVNPYLVTDDQRSDDYNYWEVLNPDQYEILFLYNGDNEVTSAKTNSSRDYISTDYVVDSKFKNDEYESSGIFAWNFGGSSKAILGPKAGFKCSSIWAFDETSGTVSLIWHDTECPAWQNYQ